MATDCGSVVPSWASIGVRLDVGVDGLAGRQRNPLPGDERQGVEEVDRTSSLRANTAPPA
jgi:hypothetical protein